MHVTLLVFSYPHDIKYAQVVDEYEGGPIEDYSVQVTGLCPQMGQIIPGQYHYWENEEWHVGKQDWTITKLHQYQGEAGAQCEFAIAILTFDGQVRDIDRDPDRHGDDICQILLTPEGFRLSWPTHIDYAAELGSTVYKAPYEVAQITKFEPCSGEPWHIYNIVRVGRCVPTAMYRSKEADRPIEAWV